MGAWGYAALDNDPALDVIQRWQEWVEAPSGIGYKSAIDRYFSYWGDAVHYGDPITNMEVIALLAIHLNAGLTVPKRLVKAAADAINRELVPGELSSWNDPERRKEVLLNLLAEIGAKVKTPKPPKIFRDPAIHFKNTAEARSELLSLARFVYPQGSVGLTKLIFSDQSNVPGFLRTLHRLMMHHVWEKDWKIVEQAEIERQMMLAWYLGITSGRTVEDIAVMLDRCGYWRNESQLKSHDKEE